MDSDKLLTDYMHMVHDMKRMQFDSSNKDISRGSFMPMAVLKRFMMTHPDMEGMYVSDLAGKLHVSSPAVSRMLKSLEEKELIERRVDRNDRRNTFIRLTVYGNQICEERYRRFAELHEKVFDEVGREDVEKMTATWNRLQKAFYEEMRKRHPEMPECCCEEKGKDI